MSRTRAPRLLHHLVKLVLTWGRMKRATVTISDELEASLDAYMGQQEVSPSLTAVVQTALREYLARRGFDQSTRRFRITPARKGSGSRDVSIRHDRYLAGE